MGSRDNGAPTGEVLRRTRLVKGRRLGVEPHIPGEDGGRVHERVVEVVFSRLDEEHLEVVVQIGQSDRARGC